MPPALTVTIGRLARGDTACSACATRLLPVPFSPVMSTLASDGPTRATISSTGRIAGDSARIGEWPSACGAWLAASSWRPRRSARPSSVCVRTIASSRSLSHGFWTKSRAPRRIASTATFTDAPRRHDDHRQRLVGGVNALEQLEPFLAGRRVARVVEIHQDDVEVLQLQRAQQLLRRGGGFDE